MRYERTSYNACEAMSRSNWWTFHFAFCAIHGHSPSMFYGDFQLACEDGIIFG